MATSLSAPPPAPTALLQRQPLWLLPLIAGLLPALAALLALGQFALERGAFCNPFIDDCVSISRMAKHGLANHLFRALAIPGAVLQTLTWLIAARVFSGVAPRTSCALACLGAVAGTTLVVYASFLGSDGAVYGWLRQWGPLLYFGGTYAAMLLLAYASGRLQPLLPPPRQTAHARTTRTMHMLLAFIAAISLVHGLASAAPLRELEDRIENLSEWWGALAMTIVFALVAAQWRELRLTGFVSVRPARADE